MATILADYDSDQQFAAFGFGAKVPEFGGMSHCFPLNFNIDQPKVNGLEVNMVKTVVQPSGVWIIVGNTECLQRDS